jgi:hypothetical protein
MRNYFPTFSARIRLKGDQIQYIIENQRYEFSVSDILLVGEFSAPPGVFAADYFFTFLVRGMKETLDIPAYTEGVFELLTELRGSLEGMRSPKLQMSSEFASSILFPEQFAGQKLYDFQQESRPWINVPVLKNLVVVEKVVKEMSPELAFLSDRQ